MVQSYVGWEVSFRSIDTGVFSRGVVVFQNGRDENTKSDAIQVVDKANRVSEVPLQDESQVVRERMVSEDEFQSAMVRAGMSKWKEAAEATGGIYPVETTPQARGGGSLPALASRLHQESKENDLLSDIMQSLSHRGLDPVVVLNEAVLQDESDDDEEEEDDESDETSTSEDEDESDEDEEHEEGSSGSEESEGQGRRGGKKRASVRVKFVAEGIPGRDQEIRAAQLPVKQRWVALRRRLRREYGGHGWLVSYEDEEGDRITIRSQEDLAFALSEHFKKQQAGSGISLRIFLAPAGDKSRSSSSGGRGVVEQVPEVEAANVGRDKVATVSGWGALTAAPQTAAAADARGRGADAWQMSSITSWDLASSDDEGGASSAAAHVPRRGTPAAEGDQEDSDGSSSPESPRNPRASHRHHRDRWQGVGFPHSDIAVMDMDDVKPVDDRERSKGFGQQRKAAFVHSHAQPSTPPQPSSPRSLSPRAESKGTARGAGSKGTGGAARDEGRGRTSPGRAAPAYWRKGELLGQGAFGKVYAAIDLKTGQWLAVKQVKVRKLPDGSLDPKVLALQQEISLLQELDHPNIIKYLGTQYTHQGTRLNIFLEHASEGSVQQALRKFGALPEMVIRQYCRQLLSGLAYLHSRGVIHRDIKASNVLINKGQVKLADFGCSKKVFFFNNDASEHQHSMIGTTIYMAPEVMKSDENDAENSGYGRKADIWSLGMMVLEMAKGKPPYSNPGAAIYKVCMTNELPPFPASMSTDGQGFVAKCLDRDPTCRPDALELQRHPFCETDIRDPGKLEGLVSTSKATPRKAGAEDLSSSRSTRDDEDSLSEAGRVDDIDALLGTAGGRSTGDGPNASASNHRERTRRTTDSGSVGLPRAGGQGGAQGSVPFVGEVSHTFTGESKAPLHRSRARLQPDEHYAKFSPQDLVSLQHRRPPASRVQDADAYVDPRLLAPAGFLDKKAEERAAQFRAQFEPPSAGRRRVLTAKSPATMGGGSIRK